MSDLGPDIGGPELSGPELNGDEALAAEHALGVLTAEERAAAQARAARDPAFAAAVETWRARLAPMAAGVAPVTPPPGLWPRIERALPVNDNALAGRLTFWRRTAMGSLALAAASLAVAVAVTVALQPPAGGLSPAPMLNARLASAGGEPMFVVAYDPGRRALLIASLMPPDPGHAHELWLIPADGRPRSLGMIEPGASKAMPMDPKMAAMTVEGAALAVSLEPLGGSRSQRPSGPMAAVGKLSRI